MSFFKITDFLDRIASQSASPYKNSLWVVDFGNVSDISETLKKAVDSEPFSSWQLDDSSIMVSSGLQAGKGCLLVQAVSLPGQSMVVNPEGSIMSNNFVRDYVGQGRNAFPELRVVFLETNTSIIDNIMRPWAIATSKYGLWANPTNNYRCDITVYKILAGSDTKEAPKVSSITFHNACCVSVGGLELNYAPHTSPATTEAQFVYQGMSVKGSPQ